MSNETTRTRPACSLNCPVLVVGISGASRAGKTRLANHLLLAAQQHHADAVVNKSQQRSRHYRNDDVAVTAAAAMVVRQDSFWKQPTRASVEALRKYGGTFDDIEAKEIRSDEEYACTGWNGFEQCVDSALDNLKQKCAAVADPTTSPSSSFVALLIVEGFQLLYSERIRRKLDLIFHLDVDRKIATDRRSAARSEFNPIPKSAWYCSNVLWPTHLRYQETIVRPLGKQRVRWRDANDFDSMAELIRGEVAERLKMYRTYAKLSRNYRAWLSQSENLRGKPVVLVSTGSYSPIHLQHTQMFEEAKIQMEQRGYQCLAGFLSPSHDSYVRYKLYRSGFIPSDHRFQMIELAVAGSSWLSAHPWEMSQPGFVDYGPTLLQIRSQIREWLGNTSSVQVRYLCGTDHALKCGLLRTGAASSNYLNLVALGRPGSQLDATAEQMEEYNQRGILIIEDEALFGRDTARASSSDVRRAVLESPEGPFDFLDRKVETYLRDHGQEIGDIYEELASEPSKYISAVASHDRIVPNV